MRRGCWLRHWRLGNRAPQYGGADAVAPGALGHIELAVGLLQQLLGAGRAGFQGGHANAQRQHGVPGAGVGQGEPLRRLAYAFGQGLRLCGAGVGQQAGEFLAPVARRQVGGAGHHLAQHLGHGAQVVVPDGVAIGVVHALEVIHVQQQQAQRLARALLADKPWLVLDEPSEGLDPDTERALCQRLSAWLDQTGTGLVLVSRTKSSRLIRPFDTPSLNMMGSRAAKPGMPSP